MVRKGGLEPPCLTAPPPQDGVSANSTTSAFWKLPVLNSLAMASREGISNCTRFCTDFGHAVPSSRRCKSASRANSLCTAASRGCTWRIVVLMLSCPATYCKAKGDHYQSE